MTKVQKLRYTVLAALLTLALLLPLSVMLSAHAETEGRVYVHFYNPAGYECDGAQQWGAYYWTSRANTVLTDGEDATFYNEKSNPDVKARMFTLTLTANEVNLIKSGTQLGVIMVWTNQQDDRLVPNWNKKDVSTDRLITVSFDANNEFHVYVIAGDKENYFSLEQAKTAFERIESVQFDDIDKLIVQTTDNMTKNTEITVTEHIYDAGKEQSVVVAEQLHPESISSGGKRAVVRLPLTESTLNMHAGYEVKVSGYAYSAYADKTRLYISPYFKREYEPAIGTVQLGATYSREQTTFRVWAPVSSRAILNLYRTGNPTDGSIYANPVEMTRTQKGVYEATVEGDLHGVYYTYTFTTDGKDVETIDVNATTAGINGDRGMVVDMLRTNPNGWAEDLKKSNVIRNKQLSDPDPIIWEVHMRDFSVDSDSGMNYKGKYLAFTETGTTVKGNPDIATGIDHLKELGVTYVHLLPVYDFDKVDESRMGDPSYTGKFNWGYDPKNYNVPEGSYSTDPYNGAVRVNEFKQMVAALHDAGIGVIMDVVYNHTFSLLSPLNKTVPGYYYRQALTDGTGSFGYSNYAVDGMGNYVMSDGTGCGNETASEREMYGQYMRTSVAYWAKEYHIDGFRFDLMAVHNIGTMNAIRSDLDALEGGAGKGIIMYGEPWSAGGLALVENSDSATWSANNSEANVRALRAGIKIFDDKFRNATKGGNDENGGYLPGGYVTGQGDQAGAILAGIGGTVSNQYAPDKMIAYTTAHDNYLLNDHLLGCIMPSDARTAAVYQKGNATVNRMNKLAATLTLTSKGTPFLTSGEEFARTKYGNHNSYASGDKVNALSYARKGVKADLYAYYRGLIALRHGFSPLRNTALKPRCVNYDNSGVIMYAYESGSKAGDLFSKVAIIANPYAAEYTLQDTNFNGWKIIGTTDGISLQASVTFQAGYKIAPNSALIVAVAK